MTDRDNNPFRFPTKLLAGQKATLESLGLVTPDPDDPWPEFNATRDAELEAARTAKQCVHGAPKYLGCVEVGDDNMWCSRCGSLGEFGSSADAGHQVDLPNDSCDGRGFGYCWIEPEAEMLAAAAAKADRRPR